MKITIIGYSGSGKSTLAENLARYYSIPKLHMDTLQFQPGWIDSDRDWMEEEMKQFLSNHRDWVIDGNYSWCHYEESWNCLYRGLRRYRRYKGRVRESMAAGCPERFDWEFIRWILWDGRTKNAKERYQNIRSTYPDKFITLKNQKELDRFFNNIKNDLLESK